MAEPRRPVRVEFRRLPHAEGLELPLAASARAAGFDLRAALETGLELAPGARAAIPTGLCLALPAGWEGQVRPRSGLAVHHGVTVLNSPGTIDADYRGEVAVVLINLGAEPFEVRRGDRIAQLLIAHSHPIEWVEAVELEETARGAGGFGSSGVG